MPYSYAQELLETCPVCQKRNPSRWLICKDCGIEYGQNPRVWPEWLRFLVNDVRREAYQERCAENTEVSLDEMEEAGIEIAVDIYGNR